MTAGGCGVAGADSAGAEADGGEFSLVELDFGLPAVAPTRPASQITVKTG